MDFLSAAGERLEARAIGVPSASESSLVFLHEGLGSAGMWRDFPDRLCAAAGMAALVYSRRGYGASDAVTLPRPLTFLEDEADRVLPAVLRATGIARPVLVGHSDGASIALYFAARRPAEVRAVVAMAPHVFVEDVTITSIARMKRDYESTDLRARLARHHGANVDGAFLGWSGAWLDPGFREALRIDRELDRIIAPILAVQGRDDEYGTLAQLDAIERLAKGRVERAVLAACGHSPQKDQPDATLARVAAFVRSAA